MGGVETIVLGGFLSLLLGVNAFFLKDILKTLKNLELKFIQLDTEHSMYSKLVNKHDDEIDAIRERLHTLEGGQSQLLKWLEENEDRK